MGVGYNALTMMQNHFARFEDRVQRLIEGGFARLFAGRLHPREVATQLARAMEDHARQGRDGRFVAPDRYTVRLNARDHEAILAAQPDLPSELAVELISLARLSGLLLENTPEVYLLADDRVELHQVKISAHHSGARRETTQAMPFPPGKELERPVGLRAALITKDERVIPLERPILNIGRARDNHVIIDAPSVSRHHAQLRLRFGRYVLFDLGSRGGTTVNGQPVKEAVLQPGDVISLAGFNLIYTEEEDPTASAGEDDEGTRPYSPTTASAD
ncbi:MAG TPA: DUF2662 domain-containing protein [Chloroflexi bacterium]|nr:DUF2662 domain-containing protein [Chloroflexota bacterium]